MTSHFQPRRIHSAMPTPTMTMFMRMAGSGLGPLAKATASGLQNWAGETLVVYRSVSAMQPGRSSTAGNGPTSPKSRPMV
jgi:hypothetical protein